MVDPVNVADAPLREALMDANVGGFVARRLLQAVPTFFGITLLSFVVLRLAPGDPVLLMFGGAEPATPRDLAAIRAAYGLDQPLPVQYLAWLGHLLSGDFGRSFLYNRPVLEMIEASLPNTLVLAGLALLRDARWSACRSASWPRAIAARGSTRSSASSASPATRCPASGSGCCSSSILSVQFRLFPVGGMLTVGKDPLDVPDRAGAPGRPRADAEPGGHRQLFALHAHRDARSPGQDYVRTARAKGLRENAGAVRPRAAQRPAAAGDRARARSSRSWCRAPSSSSRCSPGRAWAA